MSFLPKSFYRVVVFLKVRAIAHSLALFCCLGVAAFNAGQAQADLRMLFPNKAVVVGINHYGMPNANNLNGSVADALAMADFLKQEYDFEVTLLTDEKATKKAITDALSQNAKAENFVFYYSGHGFQSSKREPSLVPSDSLDDAGNITVTALQRLIQAMPVQQQRLIILDASFAQAFKSPFKDSLTRTMPRRPQTTTESLTPQAPVPDQKDLNIEAVETAPIIYLTAARANERAYETSINNQSRGVFTYFLLKTWKEDKGRTWGELRTRIGEIIDDKTLSLQHPMLSDFAADLPIFNGSPRRTLASQGQHMSATDRNPLPTSLSAAHPTGAVNTAMNASGASLDTLLSELRQIREQNAILIEQNRQVLAFLQKVQAPQRKGPIRRSTSSSKTARSSVKRSGRQRTKSRHTTFHKR